MRSLRRSGRVVRERAPVRISPNRLMRLFLKNDEGRRPCYGGLEQIHNDAHWRDLIIFNEYFHGDNGAGLGAGHQTGWTGLVAKLIQQFGEYVLQQKSPELIEEEYAGDSGR
ncbi:MAG: hypothetical protein P8X90_25390 [Desulfobacterales bacterium]